MNSIHDMGGMHGMGPIQYEKDEPVFHAPWEGRVYALSIALSAWGKSSLDARRYALEILPPSEYLRMSYYEKWFARLLELPVKEGLVTRAEVENGTPAQGSARATPPLTADRVMPLLRAGRPANRDVTLPPRFQTGQRVQTRNIHPITHTRLPRYARDKFGTIERDHGVFVFPDTNAHFQGENPQHVYSVRFAAQELWGDQVNPRDSVYIGL